MKRLNKSNVYIFRLGTLGTGVFLLILGVYSLVEGLGSAYLFLGGFLFLTGLQIATWSVGIHLELLGNVPTMYEYAPEELEQAAVDHTSKGIDKSREAAQQLHERASEYYESTRQRAGELYSQAATRASEIYLQPSEKVGEVAHAARETDTLKTSTVQAAIDAGKKAYQEEKRKTELSGRIEAAPEHKEKDA